jgi:hypothetical protein
MDSIRSRIIALSRKEERDFNRNDFSEVFTLFGGELAKIAKIQNQLILNRLDNMCFMFFRLKTKEMRNVFAHGSYKFNVNRKRNLIYVFDIECPHSGDVKMNVTCPYSHIVFWTYVNWMGTGTNKEAVGQVETFEIKTFCGHIADLLDYSEFLHS